MHVNQIESYARDGVAYMLSPIVEFEIKFTDSMIERGNTREKILT